MIVRGLSKSAAAFGAWWLGEFQASLPEVLRLSSVERSSWRLVVRPEDAHVTITLVDPSGDEIFAETTRRADYTRDVLDRCIEEAAAFAGKKLRISLALPEAVTHSVTLPEQARARAEDIVRETICRKTPLKMEDVFVAYELQPSEEGKLELRYLFLPESLLAAQLAALSIAKSDVSLIEGVTKGDENPVIVPIARKRNAVVPIAVATIKVLALVSGAGLLLGATMLPWRQHVLLTELEGRVESSAPSVKEANARLRLVRSAARDIERFARLRAAPGVVQIWEECAGLFPASTYLTELDVRGSEVHASGYTSAAPDLIHLVEKSTLLHGAAFSGPVVFDRGKGKEHFVLRASLTTPRLPPEERD